MALYVRLDRTTVEGLVRRFGIEDVTAFSVMDGGSENTNYCVNTISGKYVLTLCDQKSLRQVTDLVSLLVHLTGHGIRTSSVVVPIGASIVILHDEKPIMLKRYVDGDITADLTRNVLVQLGEELACLHEISVPSFLPKSFPYGLDYFSEVMDSNLDHAYIDWLSEKKTYLQERIPQHLPKSLIHGDVFFDNVIVRDDQLMAIIDFEEACYYYRNFDLGMAIVGSCRDGQGISFEKAGYFLRAYGKKVGLQPIERESLKVFAVYAAVATSFWRFRQYHLRRPEPAHYHKHVEMQALADTISKYPESSFTELFS
ncbi:MAG: homoserine kinase [Xanthomonadales bacterium]